MPPDGFERLQAAYPGLRRSAETEHAEKGRRVETAWHVQQVWRATRPRKFLVKTPAFWYTLDARVKCKLEK